MKKGRKGVIGRKEGGMKRGKIGRKGKTRVEKKNGERKGGEGGREG